MTNQHTGAGSLDRKITIQQSTAGTDTFNAEILTWTDYLPNISAQRLDLSDTERRKVAFEESKAGQVGSYMISRFRVRSDSLTRTITARDRLTHDGATWQIKGAPYETLDGRKRFLWITAVRDQD